MVQMAGAVMVASLCAHSGGREGLFQSILQGGSEAKAQGMSHAISTVVSIFITPKCTNEDFPPQVKPFYSFASSKFLLKFQGAMPDVCVSLSKYIPSK